MTDLGKLTPELTQELDQYLPPHLQAHVNEYSHVPHFYGTYQEMKCSCSGRLRVLYEEGYDMFAINNYEHLNLCCPECKYIYVPCLKCSDYGKDELYIDQIFDEDEDLDECYDEEDKIKYDIRNWKNIQLCRFVGLDTVMDTDLPMRTNLSFEELFRYIVGIYLKEHGGDISCDVLVRFVEEDEYIWDYLQEEITDVSDELMERFKAGEFDGLKDCLGKVEVVTDDVLEKYDGDFFYWDSKKCYMEYFIGDQELYYLDCHVYETPTGPDGGFCVNWSCPQCHENYSLTDK